MVMAFSCAMAAVEAAAKMAAAAIDVAMRFIESSLL
jgi:hypothetical protein